MTELLHRPGFLGTHANFAADMTLTLGILVALIFNAGFLAARRGKYVLHGRIQTTGALLNLILIVWLMILPYRSFALRDEGGPRLGYFYAVTHLHALIGLFAFAFGNFVMLRGHKLIPQALRFNNYKPFMRTAYTLYMAATVLGIAVYVTWFVLIPNPPLFQ